MCKISICWELKVSGVALNMAVGNVLAVLLFGFKDDNLSFSF